MYRIFDYDLMPFDDDTYYVNNVIDTGINVPDHVSKRYLADKFGLNPHWIDAEISDDASRIFIDYDGRPAFELRKG